MSCPQCGCASDPGPARGRLLLAPPLGHTESKVRRGLREAGLDFATDDGLLSVDVAPECFRRVSEVMDDALTSEEARSTRAVLVDADADPSPARLLRAYSWPELRPPRVRGRGDRGGRSGGRPRRHPRLLPGRRLLGSPGRPGQRVRASLSFLNRLQPDVVKLDMELIRDVNSIPYKAEVASQILELADRIGAESVAEGVESEGKGAWVRDHGATYASGFLFGRPAPGERWANSKGT